MSTSQAANDFYVDVIAYDRDEKPVLLVQVKARPAPPDAEDPCERIAAGPQHPPGRPFLMHVDLDRIVIFAPGDRPRPVEFGRQKAGRLEPIARLDAREIFRHYEPEFATKQIYGFYLSGLTVAWLRDLAYRWKSAEPPGATALAAVGLLDRLEGGTSVMEDVARARSAVP